ncbi:MAG: tRNA pseudouridine(13) synthase TruD [Sedimentisphaerales bacterium]|nr:tRNA pseudouridine(13) synthase TruD [Sedimentisphaerales bacterium]
MTPDSILLPLITGHLPGIGGAIRLCPEDFQVDEIPLYKPGGSGSHTYALIEKKQMGTPEAVTRICRALGVPHHKAGYAGLKDTHAVTRQWISLEHVPPDKIRRLKIPGIRILKVDRHNNKIKLGHLMGNRFIIRLRGLSIPTRQAQHRIDSILECLTKKGVPNYFGPQRFGNRQDNHLLGQALAQNRTDEYLNLFLGQPNDWDSPGIFHARSLYQTGKFKKAYEIWPYNFKDQRQALRVLISHPQQKQKAFRAISTKIKYLHVSAFQSHIFNLMIITRMPDIDRLLPGDIAWHHQKATFFPVENLPAEQIRCDRFEISPTGPLPGKGMKSLTDQAATLENTVLKQFSLKSIYLDQMAHFHARGTRRSLRFRPQCWQTIPGRDRLGPYLELSFELESGCYATILLREITKVELG